MFLLSRLVRENGYKVVVTGEGADEVLAGYDIFREARVRQFWARDRSPRRGAGPPSCSTLDGALPGPAAGHSPRSFFGRDLDPDDPALSHRPRWDSTSALQGPAVPRRCAGRGSARPGADVVAAMPPESADWDPLAAGQWLEMTTLLAGYILASQGDRMLMANSVEGRFPFLDREVVEFAGDAARPAQAVRAGGEVPAQAGVRRPRPGRDPAPAEAAVPGPGRRELLRGTSGPSGSTRSRRNGALDRGRVCSTRARWPACWRSARRDRRKSMSNTDNMRRSRDRLDAAHARRFVSRAVRQPGPDASRPVGGGRPGRRRLEDDMTIDTRPFGPDEPARSTPRTSVAKITASLTRLPRRTKRRGVVVALSGGIDSSVVAAALRAPRSARTASSACTCPSGSRRTRRSG